MGLVWHSLLMERVWRAMIRRAESGDLTACLRDVSQ
jgi:hypothetical protein